jgi:hypothetical protein
MGQVMAWQDDERKMNQAMDQNKWDEAIELAKRIPATMDPWQQMPSHNGGNTMPPQAMHKVIDYLSSLPKNYGHGQSKNSFAFEAASNLPEDADSDLLHKLHRLSPHDWHVTNNILSHPNLKYEGRNKHLKDAQDFFRGYEEKVQPHHFATVRSLYSGKPEEITDHRGERGISHHELIPAIKEHAADIQSNILKDDNIPKRYFGSNKEPYIKLYRGVNGNYGKTIRNASEFNPKEQTVKKKSFTVPAASFSSWTTDPEMASRFSWGRGKIEGQPDYQGVVMSEWHPLKSVLHSSMHSSVVAPASKQTDESEILIGHPTGKMKVNTSNMLFQPEPDFSSNKRNNIPITEDATPDNYGSILKPTVKKSEELEKDRGRITFPADPKISNRPDQEVINSNLHGDDYFGAKINNANNKEYGENLSLDNSTGIDSSKDIKNPNSSVSGTAFPSGSQKTFAIVNEDQDPTAKEHEAFHILMDNVSKKHGTAVAGEFLDHLISHIPSDYHGFITKSLKNNSNYNNMSRSPNPRHQNAFKEEIINFARDLTSKGGLRDQYKKIMNSNPDLNKFKNDDKVIKNTWNKIYNAAHSYNFKVNKSEYDHSITLLLRSGVKYFDGNKFIDYQKIPMINQRITIDPDLIKSDTYQLESVLIKSLKHNVVAAATVASMIGSPIHPGGDLNLKDLQNEAQPVNVIHSEIKPKLNPDLESIKMIESTGGKNLTHKPITEGLNAGTSAYGKFGLMPLQIVETAKNDPAISNKHPELLKMHYLHDQDKIKDYVKHHNGLEDELANSHWNRLDKKFEGDKNKMAYAWIKGITGTMKADDNEVKNHDYVKKFNQYQKLRGLQTHFNKNENDIKRNEIKSFSGVLNKKEDAFDVHQINQLLQSGQIHDLSNHGHFTHNSFVVGFDKNNSWLIKIDQNVRAAIESVKYGLQSVKEAAFYEMAKSVFGLAEFTPKAILGELYLNDEKKTCVAIKMYSDVYIPAAELDKQDHQEMFKVVDQYVKDGTLHKLAAMMWILGDMDGHGKNILTNGKDMKLIDHGSSFANHNMDVTGKDVFVPYFLRVWGQVKDSMAPDEKLEKMPTVDDQKVNIELRHWLFSLDLHKVIKILTSYELDTSAAIRLEALRQLINKRPDANISVILNECWIKPWFKLKDEAKHETR